MASGSVPIFEKFWFEADTDVKIFSNSLKQVPGHPELVANTYAFNWADLEFPLTWHDLSVAP